MRKFILILLLAVVLIGGLLSVQATPPRPPKPPTPPIISTSPYMICRPGYGCYRPDPTPRYTPTPMVCKPPPGCDPARESCASVCYP